MRIFDKVSEFALCNYHSLHHDFKHFTFIVQRTTVICWGINKPNKTHPLANKWGHRYNSIHSELSAILSFPHPVNKFHQFTLINVRVRKDASFGRSKPCECCQNMLNAFGVDDVWYTNNKGKFEQL